MSFWQVLLFENGLLPLLVRIRPWVSQHGFTAFIAHWVDFFVLFHSFVYEASSGFLHPYCYSLWWSVVYSASESNSHVRKKIYSRGPRRSVAALPVPVGGHWRWPWVGEIEAVVWIQSLVRGGKRKFRKVLAEFSLCPTPLRWINKAALLLLFGVTWVFLFCFVSPSTGRFQEMCMNSLSELSFKVDWRLVFCFCYCNIQSVLWFFDLVGKICSLAEFSHHSRKCYRNFSCFCNSLLVVATFVLACRLSLYDVDFYSNLLYTLYYQFRIN